MDMEWREEGRERGGHRRYDGDERGRKAKARGTRHLEERPRPPRVAHADDEDDEDASSALSLTSSTLSLASSFFLTTNVLK